MRKLILLFLSASIASAEHGGTQAFQERSDEYRSELSLVPDARLDIFWEKKGEDWLCVYGREKVRTKVSCLEGTQELAEGGKLEKSLQDKVIKRGKVARQKGSKFPIQFKGERILQMGEHRLEAPEGWIWLHDVKPSPDGQWLLVYRERDVIEREVHYVRSSPKNSLQPKHFTNSYPKPGDELRIKVPVLISREGKMRTVQKDLIENPYSIGNVHWRGTNKIWLEYIERGFGKFRLLELDAKTGESRVVAQESSEKFVHVYEKCGWWDLGEGQVLWRSEADGWSHFYLVDADSGVRKQLTSGQWVVRGVERVAGSQILFHLSGFYPEQDPYYIHYARLDWKTGELAMLTQSDGTHVLQWSPDRKYYVSRYSRVDQPPVYELRRGNDGSLVRELLRSGETATGDWRSFTPERFVTKDREGKYDIHGVIWKPRNFDAEKRYAVVENIYAGPHGAFVPKAWRNWFGHRHEMADAGFVVVQIDGRGTNFRGRDFQHYAYKNLKDAGFLDRIKWIQQAAQSRPWMDLARVGVYGGSAGGQSTVAALIWHGDFYLAGVSDCGCHDNRMDKIWWNEQWMDWPIDESYAANANSEHVASLQGDLLLTVGELDTNVDPSSTDQVVDALIQADKDFEYLRVPNAGHGIGESSYLRRKRVEFFQRKLGSPRSPKP